MLTCALAVARGAQAQVITPEAVHASGREVSLTVQGATHRLVLPATVAVDMDTLEVLDARQVGAARYLLLSVNGPSKRKGFGSGQCGAGYETAIVWVRLAGWTVTQVRSQLVESCWHNRIIEDTMTWDGDAGVLTYQDLKVRKRFEVRYDRGRARVGFVTVPLT